MFNLRKHYTIIIACVLTGLLLAVALRTQTAFQDGQSPNKNQNMIDLINVLEQETIALEDTIDSLRKQIDQIQQQQSTGEGILVSLQNQIQQLRLQAGLAEISGSGITIVLDDNTAGAEAAKINNPAFYDPENFIVHDKNLLYLVSALRGQARAISINNQRLVNTSDIRCVGTVIMVNSTRLAPPYEISVIGNPSLLEATVQNSDEYIYLSSMNMPVKITRSDNISLPAYKGSHTFNYAQAVKEGEK